jgi:hypothetical protein
MEPARSLWLRVETIHALTYFGESTTEAGRAAGLTGFWMGYFGFRAAPLGAVGSGAVEATFFNFAPSFVRRWVPAVWQHASPEALVAARSEAAAVSLRGLAPGVDAVADRVNPLLAAAVARARAAGRPLFAANRLVALPDDPVAALWQLCTCLREHRGDGHVAALTASGLDGCEANVLISLEQGSSPEDLQRARGWTAGDWSDATSRCTERGLVDGTGGLTPEGRALRAGIEATTDRLADAPFGAFGANERTALLAALAPVASAISASGVIRYPNPMGLPAFNG